MIIDWDRFTRHVWCRLQMGEKEYQGKSFSEDPFVLLGEIKEEVADVMGWGFILWCRLNDMQKQIMEMKDKEK